LLEIIERKCTFWPYAFYVNVISEAQIYIFLLKESCFLFFGHMFLIQCHKNINLYSKSSKCYQIIISNFSEAWAIVRKLIQVRCCQLILVPYLLEGTIQTSQTSFVRYTMSKICQCRGDNPLFIGVSPEYIRWYYQNITGYPPATPMGFWHSLISLRRVTKRDKKKLQYTELSIVTFYPKSTRYPVFLFWESANF
jgi:hypothetical protein